MRLVGANNNLFDVANGFLVQNSVQVISNNSAGLIYPSGNVSLNDEQRIMLQELWRLHGLEANNPITVTPSSRSTLDGSNRTVDYR